MNNNFDDNVIDLMAKSFICEKTDVLLDAINDFSDLTLHDILDIVLKGNVPPMLQEMPIAKTIFAVSKTAIGVKQAFDFKKQMNFLKTLSESNTDPRKIAKRKKAYANNEKWFYKEVELISIYLDKSTNVEKSKLQAKIYCDHIDEIITWPEFSEYMEIVDRMFMSDASQLVEIYCYYSKRHK